MYGTTSNYSMSEKGSKKKLAVVTTHPIQYHAPLYALLEQRGLIDIKVFYTWGESVLQDKFDPGFGKVIEWDIPLLKGYSYEFVENIAEDKGSHHFQGIINPGLIEAVDQYRPDAVLVYGWSFHSHLRLMRHYKGKLPVIFRGDSTLLDKSGFLQGLKRKLFLTWLYRYIDKALYVGKANYDYFRYASVPQKKLVFGPHAIDNTRFTCADAECKEKACDYRKHLNIAHDDAVFLFAGKFEPKKAPGQLLQAFTEAGLPARVHLLMAGNGPLEKVLKEKYGSHPQVHFIEFQNQASMPALYEMADVFVLPSVGPGETWGLAVNEAMANGKPVIVSDACGCAGDLVDNGVNGFACKAGNLSSLQNVLLSMIGLEPEWTRMGKASKDIIQRYSLENLAKAVESVLL